MAKKIQHVELKDVDGNGILKEVVIMQRSEGGSYAYIETALLDTIDKARLKGIITGPHSDKYEAWELCNQTTLSNGANALDYFHQLTRRHSEKGAISSVGQGLSSVSAVRNEGLIGAESTNPYESHRVN